MSIFRKRDWRAGVRRRVREAGDMVADYAMDRRFDPVLRRFRQSAAYRAVPTMRVLVVGVQSAKRGNSLATIFAGIASDHHKVEFASCGVGSLSKPENTNALLARFDLSAFDFVVTTDDDIALPPHFTDDVVAIMTLAELDIAGPAQRRRSFHNLDITRRQSDAMARVTNYVEVGPLVVFRRRVFDDLFPIPITRFGWGVDLLWSKLVDERGWRQGIIDAVPIRHLSPAGSTYEWAAAHAEMERFRSDHAIAVGVETLTVRGHALPLAAIANWNQ